MFRRYLGYTARRLQKHVPKPEAGSAANPTPNQEGLYYGKFTPEEYEAAKKSVMEQISKLEKEIKGESNTRDKLGTMPQFPMRDNSTAVHNLRDLFQQTIKTTGPISLSAFIRQCLTHPEYGYYTTRDPLDSRSGDFITSPEISSMFGEMIGLWLFTVWQQQGSPKSIRLIEFGPGKGTLMHDMITSFSRFAKKGGLEQCEVVMIEASSVLREQQWLALCDEDKAFEHDAKNNWHTSTTRWGFPIKWVNTEKEIDTVDAANYVFAHEFFDALPVKSFERTKDGWREYVVEHTASVVNNQPKLEGAAESTDPLLDTEFHLTLSPKETPSSMIPKFSSRFKELPVGSRIEICTDAELYLMKMLQLMSPSRGAVLVVDYGIDTDLPPENSLRGIYKHKFVSPFIKPGEVDLSVDVDFRALKLLAEKLCDVHGAVTQADWLHALGLGYRVKQVIDRNESKPEVQQMVYGAYQRLTDPEQMGKIYKFMSFVPKGTPTPVGFGGDI
ncbi:hypothetical protein DICA1_E25708 [Diutina catenulata]